MRIHTVFFAVMMGLAFFPVATAGAADHEIDTTSVFLYPEFSPRISMDFKNASLVDVLKIFSKQSRLNLVASQEVAAKTVTVYLDNVPIEQALEQILRANQLMYEIEPGSDIYIVKPMKTPEMNLTTRVYYLKHASVDSASIRKLLSVSTDKESSSSSSSSAADTEGIVKIIGGLLTTDGKVMEDPRTNSLIISDIAANFPNIEQAIARLDVPVPQILIEVEMLEVAKNITDKLGVKWGDQPLVLTGGSKVNAFPFDGSVPFLTDVGNVEYEDARLTTGNLDATGFTAALNFLRTDTSTKNLARPRILTLNNQSAEIKIATQETIGSALTIASSNSSTTQANEAERVETGVFLVVTPQANVDQNEITLALAPRVIITRTGATFNNVTYKDPEERTAQTMLKVKSGDTIILGGLIREDREITVTKVPILGDIPLIGAAFRHKNDSIQERELIIFITPHILKERPSDLPAEQRVNIVREQDVQ